MSAVNDTLFIGDIPPNADASIIENAFSGFPGFKTCRIRQDKFNNIVAFVQFASVTESTAAKDALTGLLRVNPTAPPVSINYARGSTGEKRPRDSYDGAPSMAPRYGSDAGGFGVGGAAPLPRSHAGSAGPSGAPSGLRSPHTSLFVESVPEDASEREAAHIFRPFYGYRGLRFVARKERPGRLCFVDFDTPEQAASAMDSLQGYVFDLKQPEQRLRIQFAAGSKQPAAGMGVGGMYGAAASGGGMMLLGGGGGGGMMLPGVSGQAPPQGMFQQLPPAQMPLPYGMGGLAPGGASGGHPAYGSGGYGGAPRRFG